MLFKTLFAALVLSGSTTAVFGPAPRPGSEPASQPAPLVLNHDDVVLFNKEGSYSVVKDTHIQHLISQRDIAPAPPPTRTRSAKSKRPKKDHGDKEDAESDCLKSDEVQVLSETELLGSDVPMSPVVAALAATATANIGENYQIQNWVTTGASIQANVWIITGTLNIALNRLWSTTQTLNFLFQVPAGNYGIIVTEPWTRKVQGNLITGCTDNPDIYPYTSYSYTDKTFGLLKWVDGLIRLCTSQVYPIPYCVGEGTHR